MNSKIQLKRKTTIQDKIKTFRLMMLCKNGILGDTDTGLSLYKLE